MLKGDGVVGAGLSLEAVPRRPKGQITSMSSISVSVRSAVASEPCEAARALAERCTIPLLPSSFSLIYIQIDLELNQMSLFSGSQRTS